MYLDQLPASLTVAFLARKVHLQRAWGDTQTEVLALLIKQKCQ